MKKGILLLIALVLGSTLMAQSHYKVDPAHTSINFKVKHKGITFVNGKFEKFDGGIIGSLDKIEQARVFFNVEVSSVNTSVPKRDEHLRNADFFDVEKYPAMTFESTRIEKVDENRYKMHGKLQIKDVTDDVAFDVTFGGRVSGENGAETIGFIAESSINRLDYNVSYSPDGAAIGREVMITLFLEFQKAN